VKKLTSRDVTRWWPVAVAGAIGVLVVGLSLLLWTIRSGIAEDVARAQREFPGDRVEALLALVESERHPFSQRNRAVWALGQIGDPRALPVLRKHYTGAECQHDKFLCQYELKKAIDLCASPGWVARVTGRWRRSAETQD